jgi:aspartate/methionine/tyrosine aminotransferase
MDCHSERSEESPHFARCATVYTFSKNASMHGIGGGVADVLEGIGPEAFG